MTETVAQIFGTPEVKDASKKFAPKSGGILFGVELEIENLDKNRSQNSYVIPGIQYKEDGSLRGHCGEFVTYPMNAEATEVVLKAFYEKGRFTKANFTERCSTHVHVNVQDCTFVQVNTFLYLYQLFERVLFAWVGDDRDKNIFCVPWHDTNITAGAVFCNVDPYKCHVKWSRWEKYTAVNLTRMRDLGTIEFRHLAGQSDYTKIIQWIRIIQSMLSYAKIHDFAVVRERILGMNTSSEYRRFFMEVFKGAPEFMEFTLSRFGLEKRMEMGVLSIKYSVFDEMANAGKKEKPAVHMNTSTSIIWPSVSSIHGASLMEAFAAPSAAPQNLPLAPDNELSF